ncbi:hypothetical protein ERJ75_000133300 [Trypanosoma vivax]|uniref:Putative intergrin alpha chain protein n=1 Tax=Trypanosoma vivax (strain Y486) TaxID=1055687 RepID=G0TT37_TRYVY|nr:putative intergrin alpha chain protein [Trypanosoma vivax]KAH8619593.1 hypothetical protein ERJ75_000133300 [Trypanosoma vivax]CCC47118.1 putative intergrin alpha chain protein [Trypanosoma vivax Y486]
MLDDQEINLECRDVTSVSSSAPRCLAVFPSGKKKAKQRLAIGEKKGIVSVFSLNRKMERTVAFQTPRQRRPISCLTLYADQVFFVYGSVLEAYSKKGKSFFSFDTNVTEEIHSVFVATPFIITCGSFMVTAFRESKELGFYMSPDRINAMVAFVATSSLRRSELDFEDYRCIIGCNDRVIRMLRGHKPLEEISCEAPISAMYMSEGQRVVYFGTDAGSLGCLDLQRSDFTVTRTLSYIPSNRQSAVTALAVYDINGDKAEELLVGRQDGSVQVYCIKQSGDKGEAKPICIWSRSVDERILTIVAGLITNAQRPDVLVHSFSGKITAFRVEEMEQGAEEDAEALGAGQEGEERQAEDVQEEIDELKRLIEEKKQQLATRAGATKDKAPILAVSSTFTAKLALSQQTDSPALLLVVESDTILSCVTLQSEVELHFLETPGTDVIMQESNSCSGMRTRTIAILHPTGLQRCSCSVRFWVKDGQPGALKLTLLSAPVPRTAQVKVVALKVLPLFARVGGDNVDSAETPTHSTLQVEGSFTARDMHSWLYTLLQGTPELYQPNLVELHYDNVFLHSALVVTYGDGKATFSTDSLVALAIIKRAISSCASERSLTVGCSMHVHSDAIRYELERLAPHIASHNKASRNARILEALQELRSDHNEDTGIFSEEHQRLLDDPEEVAKQHAQVMHMSGYLRNYLLHLYETAVDLVPRMPKMTPTVREALLGLCGCGDVASVMVDLERIFGCSGIHKTAEELPAPNA